MTLTVAYIVDSWNKIWRLVGSGCDTIYSNTVEEVHNSDISIWIMNFKENYLASDHCPLKKKKKTLTNNDRHIHPAYSICMNILAIFHLLLLWKRCVVKSIWMDLVLYCMLYAAISTGYSYGLSQDQDEKVKFERICLKNGEYIPLSFILGVYVTQVVTRWWGQFTTIPWP
jgi:hypothetical protein